MDGYMFPDFIVVTNLEITLIPKLKLSNYKQDNDYLHSQINTTYLNLRVGERVIMMKKLIIVL